MREQFQTLPGKIPFEVWYEAFQRKGEVWVEIAGKSMEPTLECGEQILVKKVEPEEISIGDIATYSIGDILVTHRIVGKHQARRAIIFWEKGDKNIVPGRIDGKQILGKAVVVKRGDSLHDLGPGDTSGRPGKILVLLSQSFISGYEQASKIKSKFFGRMDFRLRRRLFTLWGRLFSGKFQAASDKDTE